jgi:hypothetical protein
MREIKLVIRGKPRAFLSASIPKGEVVEGKRSSCTTHTPRSGVKFSVREEKYSPKIETSVSVLSVDPPSLQSSWQQVPRIHKPFYASKHFSITSFHY